MAELDRHLDPDGSPTEFLEFRLATLVLGPVWPMQEEMIARLGQAIPRFFAAGNIAGGGLQERLRTVVFALLGLVTAVGLGLVGIAFNQGWPDFASVPIPGVQAKRIGEASVAADAVHPRAPLASHLGSPGATGPGRQGAVPGRSSGTRISSQQQLPATVPEGQGSNPPPPGQADAETPASATEPPAAEPAASVVPQPAQGTAPVPASPPVSQPAAGDSVPGKGKAKGHEKSHGQPLPPVPTTPTGPSTSPAPTEPIPAEDPAPSDEGPGNGHGNAYGHSK